MLETKRITDKLLRGERPTEHELLDLLHDCNNLASGNQRLALLFKVEQRTNSELTDELRETTAKWQGEVLARQALAQEVERLERLNAQQERKLDRLRQLEVLPNQHDPLAPDSPTIDVGAIADITYVEALVRGVVTEVVEEIYAKDSNGREYESMPEHVHVIFPASHPVAQSLALRSVGVFRLGDVVRVVSTGRAVTIKEWNGDNGAFYDTDNDHWGEGHRIELITPRELRTDIGDASGGEWEAWFPNMITSHPVGKKYMDSREKEWTLDEKQHALDAVAYANATQQTDEW
jgi:hypothetical protein